MIIENYENKLREEVNVNELDKELISFSTLPFTTSFCIINSNEETNANREQIRQNATNKVLSLIADIERSFPPQPDVDVTGIEEIYE